MWSVHTYVRFLVQIHPYPRRCILTNFSYFDSIISLKTGLFSFPVLKLGDSTQDCMEHTKYIRSHMKHPSVVGLSYPAICHLTFCLCQYNWNARSDKLQLHKPHYRSTRWIAMEVFFIDCMMCNNNWNLFHTLQKIILGSVCNFLSTAILFNRRREKT